MRIAVFAHEEYDFTFGMLERLFPALAAEHELVGLAVFPDILVGRKGLSIYRSYLSIVGPAVFAKLGLLSVWNRLAMRLARILGRRRCATFRELCRLHGAEYVSSCSPNAGETVRWVRERNIDVVLIFIGYILKEAILEAPRVAVLNKHSAPLPASKGLWPVFWALACDEPIGVTVHRVVRAIDEGEILVQKAYERREGWSVYDYYKLIFSEAADLVADALRSLESGERRRLPKTPPPSYRGLPTREDYRAFRRKGHRFV